MSESRSLPSVAAPVSSSARQYDTPLGLGSLHDLIQSALNSSDQFPAGQTEFVSGAVVTPVTPQRGSQSSQVAPLTPLTNLKVLAEASSAVEGRGGEGEGGGRERVSVKSEERDEEGGKTGRKMKSLSVLCHKFLDIVENRVGTGNEFSLDTMAEKLGTNRRRIYDIINVLEAVEMIVKQSKNLYCWNGRGGLLLTLATLKAMATEDTELVQWFSSDSATDKENVTPPTQTVARQQGQSVLAIDESSQDSLPDEVLCDDGHSGGGRWDKSLGILCQKFLMLFFIAPKHELTLNKAGSILMAEEGRSSKTKVRRLYDIANVLTTLGLIKKKTFTQHNHRKLPGYVWCGPSMEEIDTFSVGWSKGSKPLTATGPLRKMRSTSLVRRSSFGDRTLVDEYEVKDSNSAPSTPYKMVPPVRPLGGRVIGKFSGGGGGSIRRSLSFGGQSSTRALAGGCGQERKVGGAKSEDGRFGAMWTRLVCSREEFAREMVEFEKEMATLSHRFPNVAVMFQDFIRQYQFPLEQTGTTGRVILPKPPSFPNFSDPLNSSTPRNLSNPPKKNRGRPETLTTTMAESLLGSNKKKRFDVSCKQPHLAEDSGLGDSLVGGALMTSLDDITGIAQKPDVKSEATEPQSENIVCLYRHILAHDGRRASAGTETDSNQRQHRLSPTSLASFPTTRVLVPTVTTRSSLSHPPPPKEGTERATGEVPLSPRSHKSADKPQIKVSVDGHQSSESAFGDDDRAKSASSLSPEAAIARGNAEQAACSLATQATNLNPGNLSNSPTEHSEKELNPSRPIPPGFTKGTLQSPRKPAHVSSQSFVRVDDFLASLAAQSREAESFLRDPKLVAKLSAPIAAQSHASLLSRLLTRQPLPGATDRKPPAKFSAPLHPMSLVNQKPIPATGEMKSKTWMKPGSSGRSSLSVLPQPPSATMFSRQVPAGVPLGVVTPGNITAAPISLFLPPHTVLPPSGPGLVAVAPRMCLLPFSTLCCSGPAVTTPPSCCPATLQDGPRPSVSECPPLKRAKLVE